ncbi:MAG: hypothetical protein JJE21_07765 [Spirochaetaceae bacterium]|nr:hypothetical protein [Spirochaetaceae bacterium]
MNLYELNKGKVKNINLVGDIDVLEGYTNKIHQSFINIIDKLESQKGDLEDNSQKNLQIYKEKVNNLEEELEAIKVLNSARQTELKSSYTDNTTLKEQYSQLQESLQDKLTIIKEYQGKNDTLTGILEEYKQFKVEVLEYKKLLEDKKVRNNSLSDDNKNKNFTINNLTKDIENLKEVHEKSINELTKAQDQLKDKHLSDLEQLKDKADIKMDKALIELQKSQQEQLTQEQLKHYTDIQEYQNKYKSLLEELENVRTIPKLKKDNAAVKK